MTFIALYDASVLYPAAIRDLLVRLASKDLFQAKWTEEILEEMVGAILRQRADLTAEQLQRTCDLMNEAVRDCLVSGYEPLVEGLHLPDADDRHVLAAAIRAGAQVIVTSNLKDFPEDVLDPLGIEAQSPDEFVVSVLDLNETRVIEALHEQASSLRNPPQSVEDVLRTLENQGLVRAAAEIRTLLV